ncbi:hypothetical protein AD945_01800 [Gluconobacter albidus]|uniref:Uncharacterized protein n=1 Tax=Gluconobacter albidus TaxID=318683 RepID=A0A149TMS0_9PROT|nr:hypothetical protein [Gluconobacter albidus]KXV50541.1 hypothetical protein AD945_01800 [Gluconobacter albidus]
MALQSDRILVRADGPRLRPFGLVVATGQTVFRGSIAIVFSDGTIAPAGTATPSGLTVAPQTAGIATHFQSNVANPQVMSGQYGPAPVELDRGTYALPFDTAPTWDKLGSPVYAVDDETVSLTETPSGGSARTLVGTFAGLDETGTPFVTL